MTKDSRNINVKLPMDLYLRLNAYESRQGLNHSQFIEQALDGPDTIWIEILKVGKLQAESEPLLAPAKEYVITLKLSDRFYRWTGKDFIEITESDAR